MTSPSAWAVERADALMDALREGGIFPDDWRNYSAYTDTRNSIALALDEARADERGRAAKIAEARDTIFSRHDGTPIGDCPTWDDGERIAAAIRTPAPETDNG